MTSAHAPTPAPAPPSPDAATSAATDGPRVPLIPGLAALGLIAVAFAPGIRDMVGRWQLPNGYYGHGPIVPLVCAWVVWRKRARLRELPISSSWWGIPIVLGATLLLGLSLLEDVHYTQNVSFVAALFGATLVLFGWAITRELLFAFAFMLLFMVPLPQVWIAQLTFDMKILAARLSVKAIQLLGFGAVLDGSTIHLWLADGSICRVTVEEVCSGLRTLIALLAIAAIFVHLETSRLRAALTLLLAVPIAIVANVVRILLLVWLNAVQSPAAHPDHPMHELTGLAVYIVALILLMGLRSLPLGPNTPEGRRPASFGRRVPRSRLTALLVLLGLGAACSLALGFDPPEVATTQRTKAIPLEIGDWVGEDHPVDPRIFRLLGTEDIITRTYRHPDHPVPVDLYVVHANDSRKVAHPPEICFSGGGYVQRERSIVTLDTPDGPLEAVRMVLDRGRSTLLVYYWYRLDGRNTPNYLDHQLDVLLRRLRRQSREGSMVRLSVPVGSHVGAAAAEAAVGAFVEVGEPGIGRALER